MPNFDDRTAKCRYSIFFNNFTKVTCTEFGAKVWFADHHSAGSSGHFFAGGGKIFAVGIE